MNFSCQARVSAKVSEISKNKKLVARLKRDVPQIDEAVRCRIENSKKRGIKR